MAAKGTHLNTGPIRLDVEAYIKLKEYAKDAGLTLGKAVYQASSIALNLSKECKK